MYSTARMALRRRHSPAVGVSAVLAFMSALTSRASGSTCEKPAFNDVASRTLQSTLVFQGHLQAHTAATRQPERHRTSDRATTINVVEFNVTRVLKSSSSGGGRMLAETRTVSVIADCSLDTEDGDAYVVFAVEELSSRTEESTRRPLYQVLGQPIQSSRRVIRQVLEYTCDECGGVRPTIRLRPRTSSVDVRVDQRLRLQCTAGQGRPPPRYVWTKNDAPLTSTRHLQIKQLRRGSRLQVRRVTEQDSGVYKCQAVNVVGNSSVKATRLNVTPVHRATTEKFHSQLCATQDYYCLNGGTCYTVVSIQRPYCQCPAAYDGTRCEVKVVAPILKKVKYVTGGLRTTMKSPSGVILLILLSSALLAVVTTIIITITSILRNKHRKRESSRRRNREFGRLIRDGQSSSNSTASSNAAARISAYRSTLHSNVADDIDTQQYHRDDVSQPTQLTASNGAQPATAGVTQRGYEDHNHNAL